jgi:hypothetical protein
MFSHFLLSNYGISGTHRFGICEVVKARGHHLHLENPLDDTCKSEVSFKRYKL